MNTQIDQHFEAVLNSEMFDSWVDRLAHTRMILVDAQEKTGIPYTELCTCGRPKVCLDCVIERLRDDWHLEGAQPNSYEEWADLACDAMDLFAEEEAKRAETHSESTENKSN